MIHFDLYRSSSSYAKRTEVFFFFGCFAVLLLYCGFHYPSFYGTGVPVLSGYSHYITKQRQTRMEVQQPDK